MRILRATLIAAVAAVALSACTSKAATDAGPLPSTPTTTTPSRSATPTAAPISHGPTVTPAAHAGTAFFLDVVEPVVRLKSLRDGHVATVVTMPSDASICTANTVTVAPDGKHIAWVRGAGVGTDHGTFMLADIDGKHPHTLSTGNAACYGTTAVRWVEPGIVEAQRFNVDPPGGKLDYHISDGSHVAGDPGLERGPVWSVTGSAIAATGEDGVLTVANLAAGTEGVPVRYTPTSPDAEHYDGWEPRSVSIDARYLAVGWIGTDPSRRDDAFAIVDVTTGTEVKLPEAEIDHAEFLADDTLVVAHGKILDVLDGTFHKLRSVTIPATLADVRLVRFVG